MTTLQVALQKTSSIKMFDPPRQALRALVGAAARPVFQQHPRPADIAIPRAGESFTHLKLTAEKMLQEQASVKSDLEISNAKLSKAEEQVRALESKLQEAGNENAMLRVKHKEDSKLWTSLESKISSTSAFFDQITETLHSLECQVQQAEATKTLLEDRLRKRDQEIQNELEKYENQLADEKQSALEKVASLEKKVLEMRSSFELQFQSKQEEFEKRLDELSQKNSQALTEVKQQCDSRISESNETLKRSYEELLKEKESALQKLEAANIDGQQQSELQLQAKQEEAEKRLQELSQQNDQALAALKQQYEELLKEKSESAKSTYEELLKEKDSAIQKIADLEKACMEAEAQAECRLEEKQLEIKELNLQNEQAMVELKLQHEKETTEAYQKKLADEDELKRQLESSKSKYDELLDSGAQKASALEKANLEIRKQMEVHLEAKQAEVAKHLKELSQQNDQAMTEMKRHYEKETKEALQKKLADDEELKQELESTRIKYEQLLQSASQKTDALEKALLEAERRLELRLEAKQVEITKLTLEVSRLNDQLKNAKDAVTDPVDEADVPRPKKVQLSDPPAEEVEEITRGKKVMNRKLPLKRKRAQQSVRVTMSPPPPPAKQDRRKKAARQARQSTSGENDLFGDCLDPYRDDPYAFA